MDLTNPPPAIGWKIKKESLERGPVDTVLALALVHHLVISNNLPLEELRDFFASICSKLIIEFVPKSDSQVKKLLQPERIFSELRAKVLKIFSAKIQNS